jgi:hypothetical protein
VLELLVARFQRLVPKPLVAEARSRPNLHRTKKLSLPKRCNVLHPYPQEFTKCMLTYPLFHQRLEDAHPPQARSVINHKLSAIASGY